MSDKWTLAQIADALDEAERTKTSCSIEPEKIITLSDRLARQISARLREIDIALNASCVDEQWREMHRVAIEYYTLLDRGAAASEEEKKRLSDKLNELSAPFSENVAYHAFLEMRRIASGL